MLLLWTSTVALEKICIRLYDNNRKHAGVQVLRDLIHITICMHACECTDSRTHKPTRLCVIFDMYSCRTINSFPAHLDTKGKTKQYKSFCLLFTSGKLSWHTTKFICTMRLETLNIQALDFSGQLTFWRVRRKRGHRRREQKRENMLWGAPAPSLCIWRLAQGSLLLWISLLFCLLCMSHPIRWSTK